MRKAKKHLYIPIQLLTPQQKLEQISLLEDDKYSFVPLTARQTKINGWVNDQNLNTSRQLRGINSLRSSIILGRSISTPKQKANDLSKNKKLLVFYKNNDDQKTRFRLHSAQIASRKPLNQNLKVSSLQLSQTGGMKLPFSFLRKKSRQNLSQKNKGKEKDRFSIQSISYPIFESKQVQANPQKAYNPVCSKIRQLLQHRRNLSTQF